jgi:catechol 2,3-dioxygenase-like lactoylglutathione lyase family enzyme
MPASARLSSVILLLRDVPRGLAFYRDGLGLAVRASEATYARVAASDTLDLELAAATSEAQTCAGYSPFLTFEVDDMDTCVPRLLTLGAVLDGAVNYKPYGRTAAVRTLDGHMVGLFERAGLPDDGETALAAAAAAARTGTDSAGAGTAG